MLLTTFFLKLFGTRPLRQYTGKFRGQFSAVIEYATIGNDVEDTIGFGTVQEHRFSIQLQEFHPRKTFFMKLLKGVLDYQFLSAIAHETGLIDNCTFTNT